MSETPLLVCDFLPTYYFSVDGYRMKHRHIKSRLRNVASSEEKKNEKKKKLKLI